MPPERIWRERGRGGRGSSALGGLFAVSPLLGALGAPGASLFEAVAIGVDLNDLSVVSEAVDEGDDAAGVGEDLVPLSEGLVGGHHGGGVLVAAVDDLEEQVGVPRVVGEVADLVETQQLGAGLEAQPLLQGVAGVTLAQVREQGARAPNSLNLSTQKFMLLV